MDFLLADIFFWMIGAIYLLVRHRNLNAMALARNNAYEGSYVNAGKSVVLSVALILFGIAVFGLLLLPLISSLHK